MLNLTLADPHDAVTLLIHHLCRAFDRSLFRSVALLNRLVIRSLHKLFKRVVHS